MRRKSLSTGLLILLVIGSLLVGYVQLTGQDPYRLIRENLSDFGEVYKQIANSYVREVDPESLMVAGIKGMVSQLDPYSSFFKKRQIDQLRIETTGRYGGLGISIAIKDDYPTVIAPFEGTPAEKVGLQAGDRIIRIEGKSTKGEPIEDVAEKLRGEPETTVTITILREGLDEPIDYTITREIIELRAVSYSDEVADGIGYIRLSRFSEGAGEEIEEALRGLKEKGIKGIILDLRGNPGGLLTEAVSVADRFLKRGRVIVFTKGRIEGQNRKYYSEKDPIIPEEIPMVVLVDGASASASEIVAGAIQESDRGLIVGTPTFGKGCVQTVIALSETSALKLTTAYYYTPSGRCINKEDHGQDKSQVFRTAGGRIIYGGGGITPDVEVKAWELNNLIVELLRKRMFFSFAVHYAAIHPNIGRDFDVNYQVLSEFRSFLKEKGFDYKMEGESYLDSLESIVRQENYGQQVETTLQKLREELWEKKEEDFQRNEDFIRMAIRREVASRLWGQRARIEAGFPEDAQLHQAIEILKDPGRYAQEMGLVARSDGD